MQPPHRRSDDLDTTEQSVLAVQLAALSGELRGWREGNERRMDRLEHDVQQLEDGYAEIVKAESRRIGQNAGVALAAGTAATVLGLGAQVAFGLIG